MLVNDEEATLQILAVVNDGNLDEANLQEFLDDECNNAADRECSDTNNGGQEEQIRYLVQSLGAKEVRRLLTVTFPDANFDWD